jgi:hypothetical protein
MTPMLDTLVRQMLYPVPPVAVPSPPPAPLEVVHLELAGEAAGLTAVAWAGGAAAPPVAPAVLFFHGNGENLETMRRAGLFAALDRLRVAYLAPDYPGYGLSGGKPSEQGLAATADAALARAQHRYPGRPVAACGWSLGAAVAVGLADRHPGEVSRLALLSAWTTLAEVAAAHLPGPLVRPALAGRYDSLAAAPRLTAPALVIHGLSDRIIPAAQGEALARAWAGPVRWVPVAGAGHNDLLAQPVVWEELRTFLQAPGPTEP